MMTSYAVLSPQQQMELLRERILELEADHFRQMLLLQEVEPDPAAAAKVRDQIDELERRIRRHVGDPDEDVALAEDDAKRAAELAAAAEAEQRETDDPDDSAVERNDHQLVTPSGANASLDPETEQPGG
jgi:hypothetical protein